MIFYVFTKTKKNKNISIFWDFFSVSKELGVDWPSCIKHQKHITQLANKCVIICV